METEVIKTKSGDLSKRKVLGNSLDEYKYAYIYESCVRDLINSYCKIRKYICMN